MENKHTPGQWIISENWLKNIPCIRANGNLIAELPDNEINGIDKEQAEANAQLIAAAPELLQMVYDLKQAVKRLSQDDLSQYDRDTEAQIEGEAHELLQRIIPDYYKNANA
mgnify:FL=1